MHNTVTSNIKISKTISNIILSFPKHKHISPLERSFTSSFSPIKSNFFLWFCPNIPLNSPVQLPLILPYREFYPHLANYYPLSPILHPDMTLSN